MIVQPGKTNPMGFRMNARRPETTPTRWWCPSCRAVFFENIVECDDCGTDLTTAPHNK